jgi:ectoine hydroxylase-related dioxygenase (phytanoyl-CoA dioxygenase family)
MGRIDTYRRDGYITVPPFLDATEVADLRRAVERLYAGEIDGDGFYAMGGPIGLDRPDAVKTLMFGWWVSDAVRELVHHPAITSVAAELLGTSRVRVWQDQVIWKPPASDDAPASGNIGWHQDYGYWRDSSSPEMLTANVVLQDNTADNGAMQVMPGSHRGGLVADGGSFFDTDLAAANTALRETSGLELTPAVVEVAAGGASFHHSLLLHGSGPNSSTTPRLAIAIGYFPDGTSLRRQEGRRTPHTVFLGPRPRVGQPYADPAFPLVWDDGPVPPS